MRVECAEDLVAYRQGGLPLVFGMTVFAGCAEMAISPFLRRLRAMFPAEMSGLVVLFVGIGPRVAAAKAEPAAPELLESITNAGPRSPVRLSLSFDEYPVDVRATYVGTLPPLVTHGQHAARAFIRQHGLDRVRRRSRRERVCVDFRLSL